MLRYGRIIALNSDHFIVRVARSACERCEAGHGCGAGLMSRLLTPGDFELTLPRDELPAELAVIGGRVGLQLDEAVALRLALRLYGFPVVAFMLGCAAAFVISSPFITGLPQDLSVLAGGILAGVLCWNRFGPISSHMDFAAAVHVAQIDTNAECKR